MTNAYGLPEHEAGSLPYPGDRITVSAWDVQGIEGWDFAADSVDSGYSSWSLAPLTDAGRQALARMEARITAAEVKARTEGPQTWEQAVSVLTGQGRTEGQARAIADHVFSLAAGTDVTWADVDAIAGYACYGGQDRASL